MDLPIEISENAIKKAMRAIVHEVAGIREIKDISYIEDSGNFVIHISVSMDLGTIVPSCANELQKHMVVRLKELMNLHVNQVHVSVKNIV